MSSRPHGRDEVRRAIIAAAKQRLASQGPSASTRDIAADANVNLGLLHRHFGTKDDLIRAVFADAAARGLASAEASGGFHEAIERICAGALDKDWGAYPRMLAGLLLAGRHPEDIQTEFPTLSRLIEQGGPESRPVVLVTLVAAFGWQVFA